MARPFVQGALRALRAAAAFTGMALVFAAASTAGVVAYADFPAGRRALARLLERALDSTFTGAFAIAALDEVSPGHLVARGVTIRDAKGRLVLSASALSVHVDGWQLARKLWLDAGDVTLSFGAVQIERAETYVSFDPGAELPTIATAFSLRAQAAAAPAPARAPREVRVWFPSIEVGHVYTRANLPGLPTLEGEFSAIHGTVLSAATGTAVDVDRFAAIVRGIGGTEAHGVGGVHVRAPGAVWTSFDGYLGELQLGSVVRVDGSQLTITADAPRAQPRDVRALWSDYPLLQDATAHVEASGTPSELVTLGRFSVGEHSTIEASGTLALTGAFRGDIEATGRNLDLRALWAKAPETSLDVDTRLELSRDNGELSVGIDGSSKRTEVNGIAVPAFELAGSYQKQGFEGHATVHESGMPVRVSLTVHPDGALDVDARSERVDLRKTPRLQAYFDGRGRADMHVSAHLAKNRLDAQLVADVNDFEYGPLKIAHGAVSGKVAGSLDAPQSVALDVAVDAKELHAGSFAFEHATAKLSGPALAPTVSASFLSSLGPTVTAKATLTPARPSHLRDLALELRREDAVISGKVSELDLDAGSLRVSGLSMQGASGSLEGSLALEPDELRVDARGKDLDLDQLARVLGLPHGALGGKIALDAHIDTGKRGRKSSLELSLSQASIQHVGVETLSVSASLEQDALSGHGSAKLPGIGEFSSDFSADLDGSVPKLRTWQRATGSVTMHVARVPLTLLAYLLPKSARVASLGGEAEATLVLSRAARDAPPSARLDVVSNGLSVALTPEPPQTSGLSISGLDATFGARIDGPSGASELTLKVRDAYGALASATTTFELDVARALREPGELWSRLQTTPVLGKLTLEERSLEQLPAFIAPSGLAGTLRADATLTGSVQAPTLSAKAELKALHFSDDPHALDLCGAFEYEKSGGKFNARAGLFQPGGAGACLGTRLARASLGGVAPWQKRHAQAGEPAWTASGGIAFEGLPIETLTPVAEAGLRGRVFGAVMFERETALPLVSAQLELRDAALERTALGTAKLALRSDGRTLSSSLRLSEGQRSLDASLHASLDWDGMVPAIDQSAPVTASVKAESLPAGVLGPLLQDVLSDVDGKLDADLNARFSQTPAGLTGTVVGKLGLREGTMKLARLALLLKHVELSAHAEQQGDSTLISVESVRASAEGEQQNVSASAKLLLNGFRLSKANANVSLSEVPLLIEGQTLATLSTRRELSIALERKPKEIFVTLNVPALEAKLPDQDSRQLIELDESPDISVAQPIAEPRHDGDPTALPWRLRFDLGKDVRLSREELVLLLGGSPELVLGEETTLNGTVQLRQGGRLLLPGVMRVFTVETGGEVIFDGENDNPRLAFSASTQIAQSLRVFAIVRGTLKTPEIEFQSDPPRSQDEIYAALLGTGTEDTDSKAVAASVGANLLGQQIGQRVLKNTALRSLELKTGSETTVDSRAYSTYSAAYPITENLWLEGSYKTLQNSDPTEPNTTAFSGTFDWRFRRNWSLRTEVGNLGAGLDLLWNYRY